MEKILKGFVFLLIIVSVATFHLSAGAKEHKPAQNNTPRPDIIIGFSARSLKSVDIRDARAAIDLYVKELGREKGVTAEGYIYEDINVIMDKIKSREIDMATISTIDYYNLRGKLDEELAYAGIRGEKMGHRYLILLRKKGHCDKIVDLKGMKFAITEDEMARIYLDTLIFKDTGTWTNAFFSSIIKKKNFSQAVLSVFFKKADACVAADTVFETMKELNPQVGRQIKTLVSSPHIIDTVALFKKDVDDDYKKRISRTAINLHNTTRGRQILLLFKLSRIIEIKESDLKSSKTLIDEYNKLKWGR
ncbi:MAG: PhnD/SsuA/transferrin family substrate-binding protein [Thermodesulfobacteriota bacterium]|nr:PhnD/SsuA/transferrin family substrate-binding protein [Thermodesulfobacteriota bacterium]